MKRTKSVKVSRKYQITIPKNIREIAGIDKMEGFILNPGLTHTLAYQREFFRTDFIKKERSDW
jgi:hypothetical protein